MRALAFVVTPLVRVPEWLFGIRAPGIDVGLCLYAASWGSLMMTKPVLFDGGNYVGLQWLPDQIWIAFFSLLTLAHAVGALRPRWRSWRSAACLLSSWIWISVAVSLLRVTLVPGVLTYAIVGFGALCGGIYIAGLPRDGG